MRKRLGPAPNFVAALRVIDQQLMRLLCCPETHQDLREAKSELVTRLNEQIAAGLVKNRAGQPVSEKLDGGLIRSDSRFLYPIRQDIPLMLIDEAIPLPAGTLQEEGII